MHGEDDGAMETGREPASSAGTVTSVVGDADAGAAPAAAAEVAAVRGALLAAYPQAVPELVGGETVGEVIASLEVARAAWERVAAAVATAPGAAVASATGSVPAVPAGAGLAAGVDPERLPTTEKIRRGLAARGG